MKGGPGQRIPGASGAGRGEFGGDALAALLEDSPDTRVLIRGLDRDGDCVFPNTSWASFVATPGKELSGSEWLACVHDEDLPRWSDNLRSGLRTRRAFDLEYRVRHRDGTYHWVRDHLLPRQEHTEFAGFLSIAFDVSGYHQSQATLRQGADMYQALAETIPALVLTTTAEGDVQYCNARLLEYCGTNVEGLQGSRWVDYIHPDDVAHGRDEWERRLSRQRPFSSEYRIRRHDGVYRWHLTQTAPLRAPDGAIQAWIGVSVDVDDRRQAEQRLRQAADELLRASEAKDEFLGMVSHELRTPITTIYGNAQVLRRIGATLDAATLQEAVSDIEQEASRLQQLVDNMFVLARIGDATTVQTEPILLGRLVRSVVADHRARFGHRAIDVTDEAGDTPVAGSPLYVEQALRNLLVNAEKYSPRSQPIAVTIDRSHDQVAVRVLDRGPGIATGEVDQVFETFYRGAGTKDLAPGAGIGLAVVRRLIQAQGGDAWIRAREGGGTEAGFTLPLEVEEER